VTELNIKGPIIRSEERFIYDWLGRDYTCSSDIVGALPNDGSDVHVIINSGGGDLYSGTEMYTAFKAYDGNITVDIIYAGSAAGLAAMGATTVRMSPVGQFMLHNVQGSATGDHSIMQKTGELLKKTNESISSAYQLKTGKSQEEILALMDKTTWMTAEEAKENGFADEILFVGEDTPRLAANSEDMLPEDVIKAMRGLMSRADQANASPDMEQLTETIANKVFQKISNAEAKPKAANPLKRFVY